MCHCHVKKISLTTIWNQLEKGLKRYILFKDIPGDIKKKNTHLGKNILGMYPSPKGINGNITRKLWAEKSQTGAVPLGRSLNQMRHFRARSMASLLVDRRVSYDDPHYPMKLLIVPMLVKIIASKYPHDKSQYVLSKSPLIIIEIPFVYIYQNAIRRHQFSCLNCLELTCFSVNYNNSLTWIKAIK